MTLVEFPLENGGVIVVRATPDDGGPVFRGGSGVDALRRAETTFEAALGTIRTMAQGVLGQLSSMTRTPTEVRVQFGLELNAKAGTILAAAGTAAQVQVELTWQPRGRPAQEQAPQSVVDASITG